MADKNLHKQLNFSAQTFNQSSQIANASAPKVMGYQYPTPTQEEAMMMNYMFMQMNMGYPTMYIPYQSNHYHKKTNNYTPRNHFNDQADEIGDDVSKYEWKSTFPRVSDYQNLEEVKAQFPHLADINPQNFDIDGASNALFVVLRSTNEDDIHKAIKYQKWTSTPKNNDTLSKLWKDSKATGIPIYLFFSVVKSNQFLGVAKMDSDFDPTDSFKFWWEGAKWFGSMKLKWIFIKEVKSEVLDHIKDGTSQSITQSKDCTKLPSSSGHQLLNVFAKAPSTPNLLQSFNRLDAREDSLRFQRENDQEFVQIFNERSEEYIKNPNSFTERKGGKYNNNYGGGYKGNNDGKYGKRNYGGQKGGYYNNNQMGMSQGYGYNVWGGGYKSNQYGGQGYYNQGQSAGHFQGYNQGSYSSSGYNQDSSYSGYASNTHSGYSGGHVGGGYNKSNNYYDRGYHASNNHSSNNQTQQTPHQSAAVQEEKVEITEKFFVKEKPNKTNKNKKKKKGSNKKETENLLDNNDEGAKAKILVNNDSDDEIDYNQEFERKNLNEGNPVFVEVEDKNEDS